VNAIREQGQLRSVTSVNVDGRQGVLVSVRIEPSFFFTAAAWRCLSANLGRRGLHIVSTKRAPPPLILPFPPILLLQTPSPLGHVTDEAPPIGITICCAADGARRGGTRRHRSASPSAVLRRSDPRRRRRDLGMRGGDPAARRADTGASPSLRRRVASGKRVIYSWPSRVPGGTSLSKVSVRSSVPERFMDGPIRVRKLLNLAYLHHRVGVIRSRD
jgi:hypothetical protein